MGMVPIVWTMKIAQSSFHLQRRRMTSLFNVEDSVGLCWQEQMELIFLVVLFILFAIAANESNLDCSLIDKIARVEAGITLVVLKLFCV